MHLLEKKIRNAQKAGRTAVIPFLTAGFPGEDSFWSHLEALDKAGADIIEIGVPFSDPVADGPVVENASRRALENGMNLGKIMEGLKKRKGMFNAGLVLMGYFNPFYQYGFERLAREAREAGVSGLIIPDLPYEESLKWQEILETENIALIPLVGLNTSPERMKLYAEKARGYVYVISVMGITGERKNIANGVGGIISRAREFFKVPVALGFGLKHPDQLKELPENVQPDAAVFGSALLTHLEAGKTAGEFMEPWMAANCQYANK